MATRASSAARGKKFRKQAAATREVAEAHQDGQAKDLALEVADALDSLARREEAWSTPGDILTLPSSASAKDVMDARRRCAVRHGSEVFLPTWWESKIGLPNILLRSSLFSAIRPGAKFLEKQLGAPRQYTLWTSGPQLCDYDRRVFAACLHYYSDNRTVSSNDDQWIETTYWQMAKILKVSYTENVHQAIRKSLTRLNSVQLKITVGGHDLPVHQIVEVAAGLGSESRPTQDEPSKGSEKIDFRVPESLAILFGPNEWSQIDEQLLHKTEGLACWLVGFYSTHSRPHTLKIKELYNFSGSICPLFDFRRRLKSALIKLQSDKVPEEIRVSSFELTKDSLLVRIASWK